MGRRSTFTHEIGEDICEWIANGKPLAEYCREFDVSVNTVHQWRRDNGAFDTAYAQARARGFDAIAENCLLIADTPAEGVETITKADGSIEVRAGDMLGHRKLQVETRLKLLSKWDPRRYGDRVSHEHTGANGGAIITGKISDEDAAKAYAEMIGGKGEDMN